ncbi:hypothetical protein JTE90_012702 [Oedothorax gibbosus]|uniref:SGF29 C-terminal domain-containing protein n=1 Tax=Oedothorax gibbosus TaxID=931172 RepID=A0AAV6W106_9ARAC|nr:hypothetical protein JTE90_012702 [Oedothorax gibbosus]
MNRILPVKQFCYRPYFIFILYFILGNMAEKHPIENMASDLNIPKEFTSQLELLKNVLLEIDVVKKNSGESALNKVELQADGKKPKASSVKSQLSAYKKELTETKEDIEKVKQALEAISVVRKACLENFTSLKSGAKQARKENSPAILKETAETLPLWVGDSNDAVPPLCGATQVDENYVANVGDMVAAFVTVKGKTLKEWILAEVNTYNPGTESYEVRDIDDKPSIIYTVVRWRVIPLPTMRANPVENPQAVFPKGSFVLALYENTTCFYKGMVSEPPSDAHKPYQIAFEDSDCEGGYSSPASVPQRYVLAFKEFEGL